MDIPALFDLEKYCFKGFDTSNIDKSWDEFFEKERQKEYFNSLESYLKDEYSNFRIFPEPCNIFRAFEKTPIYCVKVVILGQDPYHEYMQADGLAFSARYAKKTPPSLKNILREIEIEYSSNKTRTNDLGYLAEQGVFLLNNVLTVRESSPLSHRGKGWETFTDNVIREIIKKQKNVVFILWGNDSRMKKELIKEEKNKNSDILIIENVHPSPLSAHRGFFNSNMFKRANEYLVKNKMNPINW